MPDLDVGNMHNYIDKRHGRGGNHPSAEYANLKDIAAMKTRLTAISSARYPASKLASMTENDLVFAIRTEVESAGI